MRLLLLAAALLAGAAAPAVAQLRTFYVDPSGIDGNPGTAAAPWRTLQHAADTVRAGDLVVVRAGRYAGFQLEFSGTSANPIEFRGEAGAIVDAPNPVRGQHGINLEGASWVVVQGFTVTGMPRAGIRSVLNAHVTVRGNTLDANGYWGFLSGFSDDLLIEQNTASRSQVEHGIYVSNSGDRPIVRDNHVWGNNANGIHMNGDASQGGDGVITGALVERNVIHDNGAAGGSAINADGVEASRFQNNLLYGNHASGISLYRIDGGAPSRNNVVVHNTIVHPADGRWALNITDGATGTTVLNNILYNAHAFRGSITISADSLPGLLSNWNVVTNRFSTNDGGTTMTLAQWRAATGQDRQSIVAAPSELFVDPAAADYHLRTTAPARDGGTTLADVPRDLDGVPRPSGPASDIGAYEVAIAAATVSVTRRGSGGGVVTSLPAGIDCGDTCSASFAAGSEVTLTAEPAADASFVRWTGACAGTMPHCTVTADGGTVAAATFGKVFTDVTLVPGATPVRALHVEELRAAIDTLRASRNLAAAAWTDPVLVPGVTTILALHLIELRNALDAVYVADGLAPPAWGAAPVARTTVVTAAQIDQVRTMVRVVE